MLDTLQHKYTKAKLREKRVKNPHFLNTFQDVIIGRQNENGLILLQTDFKKYSHLSNKLEVTLTDFEKFHPPQKKSPLHKIVFS